jgi:hypothetical protein
MISSVGVGTRLSRQKSTLAGFHSTSLFNPTSEVLVNFQLMIFGIYKLMLTSAPV